MRFSACANERATAFKIKLDKTRWPSEGAGKSRRATAIAKMEQIGSKSVDLDGMYGVLSTKPVFNFATIHTNLINPATGDHRSYTRVLGLS